MFKNLLCSSIFVVICKNYAKYILYIYIYIEGGIELFFIELKGVNDEKGSESWLWIKFRGGMLVSVREGVCRKFHYISTIMLGVG